MQVSDDGQDDKKDLFVARLYKFMDDRGTPINKGPILANKDLDLFKLFRLVGNLGGYNRVYTSSVNPVCVAFCGVIGKLLLSFS